MDSTHLSLVCLTMFQRFKKKAAQTVRTQVRLVVEEVSWDYVQWCYYFLGLCCNLFTYLVRTPVYRSCRTTHLIWWRPYQQQILDNGRVRFVERRISSCWNEFKTTSHWLMLLHEMMNLKTLLLVMLCLECIFRVGLGARKAKEPNCEDGCHLLWNLKASSHTDIHTDVC